VGYSGPVLRLQEESGIETIVSNSAAGNHIFLLRHTVLFIHYHNFK